MLKNVTISMTVEVASWARKKAAEENTSVSRLVGTMLEKQMRQDDDYADAYRQWLKIAPMNLDAEHRLTREEANARPGV